MSGHSKWANIKHRKAAQDSKRGALFQKLVKAIIIAAKEGGGDPGANMRLKAAIERAKAVSVPAENIERAIKRGTGEIEGAIYEEVLYEAYGPGGIAVIIEATTDNKNRTTPEIRALLTRNGGSLGEAGCVSWNFSRRGVITIEGGVDEDELLLAVLDAGGEDLANEGDTFSVYTDPSAVHTVAEALKKQGYPVANAESQLLPKTTVSVSEKNMAAKIMKLLDALEEHDDVQNVACNVDIPDDVLESLDE
ncbi:YebC/PmpR family DNA-binding transcriptional regulator [Aminiphilus circumscriptus]|jgi:YebC/PmpR family DNA-binding regulatory protein|uniref:YebC/PmpR family DNA-binding transcriptional regulator n=1 Tax=Aminiphilus circumscriptus TaxID=290732 RepID=UPI000492577F|nr:YebC/PmpR family DNA-binding transcriptional regulator [Aminiphilus circumscriptus]